MPKAEDKNRFDYDTTELDILTRMMRVMKRDHGYTDEDFRDCTFIDIESMFLDECGEPDFRESE